MPFISVEQKTVLKCVALNAIVQEINKGELHTLLWELDMMSKTYYYWGGKKKKGFRIAETNYQNEVA